MKRDPHLAFGFNLNGPNVTHPKGYPHLIRTVPKKIDGSVVSSPLGRTPATNRGVAAATPWPEDPHCPTVHDH
jgi:hypothetical protein